MTRFLDAFLSDTEKRLAGLQAQKLGRGLQLPAGVDFASNDYLGLNRDPVLLERLTERLHATTRSAAETSPALGAPASRLLGGNSALHHTLEKRLATLKGLEAALLFPSGYQANLALLSTLITRDDRVLSDQQNHASIIDALRLSRAHKVIFAHASADAVEEAAAQPHPGGRTFLVTESLFSMDGDVAPLGAYARICARHDVGLIVDEAHATGCYGEQRSSGLIEEFGIENKILATVSTFGKALGLSGACVAAPRLVVEYLINRARPFIFSTAPPPILLHALDVTLDRLAELPELRVRVQALAGRLRAQLREAGFDCLNSTGPIVPVVLGENRAALEISAGLQAQGLDVRAIRPPSVAEGTARLRISVQASHNETDIDRLTTALIQSRRSPALLP